METLPTHPPAVLVVISASSIFIHWVAIWIGLHYTSSHPTWPDRDSFEGNEQALKQHFIQLPSSLLAAMAKEKCKTAGLGCPCVSNIGTFCSVVWDVYNLEPNDFWNKKVNALLSLELSFLICKVRKWTRCFLRFLLALRWYLFQPHYLQDTKPERVSNFLKITQPVRKCMRGKVY